MWPHGGVDYPTCRGESRWRSFVEGTLEDDIVMQVGGLLFMQVAFQAQWFGSV